MTGGSGFIGSNFIHHIILSQPTLNVANVDYEGLSSNPSNLLDLKKNKRYRLVKGNLAEPGVAAWIAKNADFIVHFAAETHVDRSIANPKPFLESNVIGTYNLVEALRQSSVRRLVHISTDEVYGSAGAGESFSENSRLDPSSPYSATKAASDQLVNGWTRTYKIPGIILRCTNNYGPFQHPEKLIPKTTIRAMKDLEIPLYGGGTQVRDWIFVEDFCTAIEKAMDHGEVGQVYNISAGNEVTNKEVVQRILKQLGKPQSLVVNAEDRPGHDVRYSLSSDRARKSLGWRPIHDFENALGSTVKWYTENENWWKPLANEKVLSVKPWKERW